MNQFVVTDMVDYLIAVRRAALILRAADQVDLATELLDDVHTVIGGSVVEDEDAVITLFQHLRKQYAQVMTHVVVGNRRDHRRLLGHVRSFGPSARRPTPSTQVTLTGGAIDVASEAAAEAAVQTAC